MLALVLSAGARADEGRQLPDHRELMARGGSALATGDAGAAIDAFERAASAHDLSAELALVGARMQAGEYRAALALAAHVAAEHPQAMPLYAQLLALGGQPEQAARVVQQAQQVRMPQDAAAARPTAFGASPPASARVIGTAVLVEQGRAALAPSQLLGPHASLWLRNGLGQTVRVAAREDAQGVSTLALETPLPWDLQARNAPREPFAGSPGFVVGYADSSGDAAGWPVLREGFLGAFGRDGAVRRLGIEAPAGLVGAPVFDAAGRLAGLTWPDANGEAVWRALPPSTENATPSAKAPPIAPDTLYERALRLALQVIAAD